MRGARGDEAVSAVIGAIVLLGIVGMALLYTNAYRVPEQGRSLEVALRESAETGLSGLTSRLDGVSTATQTADLPLKIARASPLLAGIVLSPARADGRSALEPSGTNLSLSIVTDAAAGGVPANDPMRVDLGNGKVLVYVLGNATSGVALGRLNHTVGGAYLAPDTLAMEGGALLSLRSGGASVLLESPSLSVLRQGNATRVAWRIPLLAGSPTQVVGGASARWAFAPGPVAESGGGDLAYGTTLTIRTDALAAWSAGLTSLVGAQGNVTTALRAGDAGTVTAIVLPPAGTPAATKAVQIAYGSVRYDASVATRSG